MSRRRSSPGAGALMILVSTLWLSALPAQAEDEAVEPYYFYRGQDFGSESLVHPLRLILNGGYGILQLDNRSNDPSDVDYRNGWKVTWRNILDPFGAIQADGWNDFLRREVIPVSTKPGGSQYWPNYTQHLIGGGMSWRLMSEWYRSQGHRHDRLWATATITAYHLLNETVENEDVEKWTTDPVADLLLFDPLSIVLFRSDRVSRFFGETLHMRDWSYQPAYNPRSQTLENMGQNFSIQWRLPRTEHWSLFYHWGTHAELGLSRHLDDGWTLSAGAGLVAKNLIPDGGTFRTVDLATSAGMFLDRRGSLLASLEFASSKDYKTRLNLYPGLVGDRLLQPGLFLVYHRDNDVTVGLTLGRLRQLPLGIAGQF